MQVAKLNPPLTDATEFVSDVTAIGKIAPALREPVREAPVSKDHHRFDQRKAPGRKRLLRYGKIGTALAVLAIGIGTVLIEQGRVSSGNAVVSAHLISLRSPIEGIVSELPGGIGTTVTRGQRLARVDNARVDDQRRVDLSEQLVRLEAQRKAADRNRETLLALQGDLRRRMESHGRANAQRLAGLVAAAERTLASLNSRQVQAKAEVDRRQPLEGRGIVSVAEMQRYRTAFETARYDTDAQAERLASLRAEAAALSGGTLSGPGGIDVAYSAQRADEVAIALANLEQSTAVLVAQTRETEARLANEERRVVLLREADVTAPAGGMIWKLGAADGERLGVGDQAVEIVDCSSAFILAAIPQDRFSDVEVGSVAKFRLSGERSERTGKVLSVMAQGDLLAKGANYAAAPLQGAANVIVVIAMSASANVAGECLVGRTARVVLPSSGGGPIDQLMRRIF